MTKKKDKTFSIYTRLSPSLSQTIEELVEEKNYDSISEFMRVSAEMLVKYHQNEDKMQDKEYREKFLNEFQPKLMKNKTQSAIAQYISNLSLEELELFYYTISNEKLKRKRERDYEKKRLYYCLRYGGEINPKVGYRLGEVNNFEIYLPIGPTQGEYWENLSDDDKMFLLEELRDKRSNLENKLREFGYSNFSEPLYPSEVLYSKIDYFIEGISKEIE